MKSKRRKLFSGNNRSRLLLTLGLAVMLPAATLIYFNFRHLEDIKRNKRIEALINRDFQYVLSISEKKINQKAYGMVEEVRAQFPSLNDDETVQQKKLDQILEKNPFVAHVFLFDQEKVYLFRSQPKQMEDRSFCEEHDVISEAYKGWFSLDAKILTESMLKKTRPINCYTGPTKRNGVEVYLTTSFFVFPNLPKNHIALGGIIFDPDYLKNTFFPQMLDELTTQKLYEDNGGLAADTGGLAMMISPVDYEGQETKPIAVSAGWSKGKPEVTRNLDDVFRSLALGIKFKGTTIDAIGRRWVLQSFLILGALSLLMIGGLVITYRSVNKEVALARLKADFVSNVSHELRTPLALIWLYAETLELGRITTQEKKEEYYRIIRKESERLTALINNILDFSRIEAGRKEYDFRETDIAELVRNTLDAYRYQIEQQGFAFEQSIDPTLPAVYVDREAIARALVNLVNNALKYSADEKFLGVKLYQTSGVLKLEVADRGIGITRREQSKIFEKFYRTGDPLVHNTKGSGLGLSLVRHITEAHGGEVQVESIPGKGSKFTVTLPLIENPERQPDAAASRVTTT